MIQICSHLVEEFVEAVFAGMEITRKMIRE